MLHVRNFLRAVQWTGEVPGLKKVAAQSAETAMGRAVRTLIENIADLLPSRGWEAGVRKHKCELSGNKYAPQTVRAVVRTLKRAGLVKTQKTMDHKTGREGYSIVFLSPAIVGLSRQWQALRLELKELKKDDEDKKKAIREQLVILQNVKLPFLYAPTGNPHEQGIAADPLLNLSTLGCSNSAPSDTGIHTPPLGGGDTVSAPAPHDTGISPAPPARGGP